MRHWALGIQIRDDAFLRHRALKGLRVRFICKSAISSVSWSQSLKFFPRTPASTRFSLNITWVVVVFISSLIYCILCARNSWSSFGCFGVEGSVLLSDPNFLDLDLPFLYRYPPSLTDFLACSRSPPRFVNMLGFCTHMSQLHH